MQTSQPDSELPLLTPLRGFAALMVLLFHARLILFPQWMDAIKAHTMLLDNSYLFVDLFFILSGLVLAYVYRAQMALPQARVGWGRFLWLRLSRVYPLFALTMLVLLGWEWFKHSAQLGYYGGPLFEAWGMVGIPAFAGPFNQSETLAEHFLLLQGVSGKSLGWNIASWSLSVEWISYLMFPLLLPLARQRAAIRHAVLPIALLVLFCLALTRGSLDVTSGSGAVTRGLASFIIGIWLCSLDLRAAWTRWLSHDLVLLAALALPLYLLHLAQTRWLSTLCVLAFTVLIAVAASQRERRSPLYWLMDNKVSRALGDWSFSIYLWHGVLLLAGVEVWHYAAPASLQAWYASTSGWLMLAVVGAFVALNLLVAALSYYCWERPAQTLLRRCRWPQRAQSGVLA